MIILDNPVYDYVPPERQAKAPPVSVRFTHHQLARINLLVQIHRTESGETLPRANWIERFTIEWMNRLGIPNDEEQILRELNRIRYSTRAALDRRDVPRAEDILAREGANLLERNVS